MAVDFRESRIEWLLHANDIRNKIRTLAGRERLRVLSVLRNSGNQTLQLYADLDDLMSAERIAIKGVSVMKPTTAKLLIIALILLLSMFAWTTYAEKENPNGSKWEYKVAYTASEVELNRLGRDGWELVTTYGSPDRSNSAPCCILKRVAR